MPMGQEGQRVLIVGGGVGGLSAALALQQAGIPVTVFEAAPQLPAVGAGIHLWVNGMAALDRFGLADTLERTGDPLEVQEFRNRRDKVIVSARVADAARAAGVRPPLHVRRGELLGELFGALTDGAVRFGHRCVGFEQDAAGVVAHFADGHEERGAVLIGADGADSTIRSTLFPEVKLRYAGYRYIRALTDFGDPELLGKFILWVGRGDRFGVHSGPDWLYWFGVLVDPEITPDPENGRKQQVLERFRDFPATVREMVEKTPAESIGRADIHDLDPLERWTDRRVAILGDAAHATSPNLGRGAGEALEDAGVLADCLRPADLASAEDAASALRRFESRRQPATASVLRQAREIGEMLSFSNPMKCLVRDRVMRFRFPRIMQKEMHAGGT